MVVYAIVPVKKIDASKRRLSLSLNLQQRKQLTVAMLEDVLGALKASVVDEILIVSNDRNVLPIAKQYGALFFSPIRRGLNCAIEEAWAWCMRNKADSTLVLPADVPLVTAKDIDFLVRLGSDGPRVVLVFSRDWGTNALFQHPPRLIHANFGAGSFIKHLNDAKAKGICVKCYYSLGLGLDIDSFHDLDKLLEIENETSSKQVLKSFNIKR